MVKNNIKYTNMCKFCIYTLHGLNYLIIENFKDNNFIISKTKNSIFSCEVVHLVNKFAIENIIYIQKLYKKHNTVVVQILFFELDGTEFLFCGNGAICASMYLFSRYKIYKVKYITTTKSNFFAIINNFYDIQINFGKPLLPSYDYLPHKIKIKKQKNYMLINNLAINISLNFKKCFFYLSGVYILTGEPHIVVFNDMLNSSRDREVFNKIFLGIMPNDQSLFSKIGNELNNQKWFPKGINLNFARLLKGNVIECCFFERGTNKESLVCCSGAVAVAAVAYALKLADYNVIQVHPKLSCCQQRCLNIKLFLSNMQGEWWLKSTHNPKLVLASE